MIGLTLEGGEKDWWEKSALNKRSNPGKKIKEGPRLVGTSKLTLRDTDHQDFYLHRNKLI